MNPNPGNPCWIELSTSDRPASRAFYEKVFGWIADEANPAFGGYANFHYQGQVVAGLMDKQPQDTGPDSWTTYIATDDARATVAKAQALGAQVIVEPMDVMELGVMAVIIDPTGALIGFWQAGTHKGFNLARPPGVPFWHELHTRDFEGAIAFYRDLFGSKAEVVLDDGQMRYATLTPPGSPYSVAGIADARAYLADGAPPIWDVYVRTADPDETARLIVAAGGKMLRPPESTPWGRMATAQDPTGVRFKIMDPPPM